MMDAKQLWDSAVKAKAERAKEMPTERDALIALNRAYTRLTELGFNDIIYCPKDGTMFDAIEPGSTGIHDCAYRGEWPDGEWDIYDGHDIWPSHPILFRLKAAPTEPQNLERE